MHLSFHPYPSSFFLLFPLLLSSSSSSSSAWNCLRISLAIRIDEENFTQIFGKINDGFQMISTMVEKFLHLSQTNRRERERERESFRRRGEKSFHRKIHQKLILDASLEPLVETINHKL